MPYVLHDKLVVAITSRALFDLDEAHEVFEKQGLEAYRAYQSAHEDVPLRPGTAFPLVKALLNINERAGERLVEVVLLSRNDADSGLRIYKSIEAAGLDIVRAAFTDGRSPFHYLESFSCDLFLSANPENVTMALKAGFAAALVYPAPDLLEEDSHEVRIAFDGDGVLFAGEVDRYFRDKGIDAFQTHENEHANEPLNPGPFKRFLDDLSAIQSRFSEQDCPIRTALVTARAAPAHKRPILTLRSWGVRIDESFFLGGLDKSSVLRVFKPHIFFDDLAVYLDSASRLTPAARVITDEIQ
jgi:5'-nucleotidase